MLSLDDPHWNELTHAFGEAADISALLLQLEHLPAAKEDAEPWFSLWSALAHQGDVYSASFAAVPHIVEALARDPVKADATYFQFPAWVECCRVRRRMEVPTELVQAYESALARLPFLVAEASRRSWEDDGFMQCALAAIAAAKGQTLVAEAVLELDQNVAQPFLDWFRESWDG
ncbi:hypothetical protein [Dyella agri]|uniref:Uncharacterized protein n=1 Tax=Dyella agri TaxID=1926869 RepID=A0ABW8KL33_9GAMM